ncbi:MAG: hypothetical protein J5846_08815, partial [Desulfovibrio sp.]|nr:hypothetical protein [Desulfovibrio sp.]
CFSRDNGLKPGKSSTKRSKHSLPVSIPEKACLQTVQVTVAGIVSPAKAEASVLSDISMHLREESALQGEVVPR